jgi:hypothetical protein
LTITPGCNGQAFGFGVSFLQHCPKISGHRQVGAKPAGAYTISNQDSLGAVFRIQRNFIY